MMRAFAAEVQGLNAAGTRPAEGPPPISALTSIDIYR